MSQRVARSIKNNEYQNMRLLPVDRDDERWWFNYLIEIVKAIVE
jgi:hypothetical protein